MYETVCVCVCVGIGIYDLTDKKKPTSISPKLFGVLSVLTTVPEIMSMLRYILKVVGWCAVRERVGGVKGVDGVIIASVISPISDSHLPSSNGTS
jgi:hypothetical protein